MRMRFLIVLAACAVTPALAQVESREGIELQNQILELRQEMQQLQQLQSQATGGYAPAPPIASPQSGPPGAASENDTSAQLVVRVSELEEQVRALQGKVEELSNQLQKQNDDLTKQIGDLSFKVGQGGGAPAGAPALEEHGGAPSVGAPPGPSAPPATPRKTPELILKEGNAALARRDYVAAEAASRAALAAGGPRQTDAQLLLARAQAGQHQYQAAAASYYTVYTHAPKSARAPEALLGVTDSLLALNDTNDACQALAKLAVEFPHVEPSLRARAAAARKRGACR
jgi:TolA-binding protein